ncbi:hypothetical protein SAMN05421841_2507 [Chryseobacterium wanjuense]|uniref:Uncharacterized protein n=1 Tax=Chryseobacterium wanjuense TaxID=356305 RepID=A0A1I0REY4_9FLAO|nr:hypothetical protein SAMN05421841_2507 [Chryseobacterium wanjuense]
MGKDFIFNNLKYFNPFLNQKICKTEVLQILDNKRKNDFI